MSSNNVSLLPGISIDAANINMCHFDIIDAANINMYHFDINIKMINIYKCCKFLLTAFAQNFVIGAV